MKYWPKPAQKFFHLTANFLKSVMYGISYCIWLAIMAYLWLGDNLIKGTKWLFSNPKRFVIFFVLLFGGFTLAAIFPVTHNFEGQLIVKEMSFTYAGDNSNRLFLNSIRNINQISVSGIQTLTLTGKFASTTYPQLNNLNTLTIELPNQTSKWSISPANPQEQSEIELKLRLQQNTAVKRLSYNSYLNPNTQTKVNQLSLLLLPPEATKKVSNLLQLDVGNKPLRLVLEDYRLPKLKLPNHPNFGELELIFQPDIQQISLPLPHSTDLFIDLPDPSQTESSQWFWGNLEVKDVEFSEITKTGVDIKDDLSNSTIISGKVRMAGQERQIEENQFLLTAAPGVKLLRNIQLHPQSPPGLEVRISGQTKHLEIGLDARFPVATIQATLLDKILPRDAIIALISFSAASFSYLLYWLVEQWGKSNQKS